MATVRIPSSLQAQITRRAISPRLAMSSLRNIGSIQGPCIRTVVVTFTTQKELTQPEREEWLAVLHWLTVGDQTLANLPGRIGFDLVHQLHGFDDAQDLTVLDLVPDLDKSSGAGRRGLVERAHNGRLDDVQLLLLRHSRGPAGNSRPGGSHCMDALRPCGRCMLPG